MKVNYPMVRKVLLELEGFPDPLEIWWTDEEIDFFRTDRIKDFEFFRLRSLASIIEFKTSRFKRMSPTKEIRHNLSPFVILSHHNFKSKRLGITAERLFDDVKQRYTKAGIAYFLNRQNELNCLDLSNWKYLDILFNASFDLFDTLMLIDGKDRIRLSSKDLIYVEYT